MRAILLRVNASIEACNFLVFLQNVWSGMACMVVLIRHHTIPMQMAASELIPLAPPGWRPRVSRLPRFGDTITTYAMSTPRSRMVQSDQQGSSATGAGYGAP